MDHYWN